MILVDINFDIWKTNTMIQFIQTATTEELIFISKLDYGKDANKHLDELQKVIFSQNGLLKEQQYWFPHEIIEMGANALMKGHEREFVICTLLLILNAKEGAYSITDLSIKFDELTKVYDVLPEALSQLVLESYASACF